MAFLKILAVLLLLPGICQAAGLIIDPGHSPRKPGATSCVGASEYKYNEELAGHILAWLRKNGIDAVSSRKNGEELSLAGRAAKSEGKDLFISIHHDSVQPQFISMANGRPTSGKASGYSIFLSRKNPYFDKSLAYARLLGEALHGAGLRPSRHHGEKIKGENRELLDEKLGIYAFDDLVVLKKSRSPALLLEAGVLVHPEDEARVRTGSFRQKIAAAIQKAYAGGQGL